MALLGDSLSEHFSSIWINNAGLDGHSTFGHRILMDDLIAPLRPSVTLFLVGINEIGRSGLIIDEKKFQGRIQTESPKLFLLSAANGSETFTLGVNIVRYLKARRAGLMHDTQLNLAEELARGFSIDADERARILALHRDRYLPDYAGRLEALVKSTEAAGSRPVFITQPVLHGPVTDDVTGVDLGRIPITADMDGALAWQVLELYNDVLRATAEERGLLLIDLAKAMPKSSALYYDTIHFSNEGAEVVAREVFKSLCPWLAREFSERVVHPCATTPHP